MAGNDGTLNQRETGVGIFDQMTFQNDAPAFGGEKQEQVEQTTHEMSDVELESLLAQERTAANENNPEFWEQEKQRLETEAEKNATKATETNENKPAITREEAEAKGEGVYGGANAEPPQQNESQYSAMFADEELEEAEQEAEENDYAFLTDDETEAKFEEYEREQEAAGAEAQQEQAEEMELER